MQTQKLYYSDVNLKRFDGTVLSCEQEGKTYRIILDKTAFYPEGGGQPADRGVLGGVHVLDVREKDDVICHICDGALEAGAVVTGEIDWNRRFDHMQQHSGEHIVSGMICSTFGCDNTGFHLGEDIVTIDYNTEISWEDLLELEKKANAYIWEDHAFEAVWPDKEALASMEYRSKKELDGEVRITSFPGADCCACCGTHVERSGQVGIVKFISVQKFRNGVRIELLCGKRAYEYLSSSWKENQAIAKDLSVKVHKTYDAFDKMRKELASVKIRADKLEEASYDVIAEQYRGAGNVLRIEEEMSGDGPRKLCDRIAAVCGGRAMVYAGSEKSYRYVVIHKDQDIRDLVKNMNAALNGRGGGRDGFAQGSVQADAGEIKAYYEQVICR